MCIRDSFPDVTRSAISQHLGVLRNAGLVTCLLYTSTPHLLDRVTGSQGQSVESYQPKPWLTATSPATASKVTTLMLSVVNSPNGTGVAARIPGIQVAGKTGTAQTGLGYIETWFVSFAPVPDPRIAVAVLVEDQPPT